MLKTDASKGHLVLELPTTMLTENELSNIAESGYFNDDGAFPPNIGYAVMIKLQQFCMEREIFDADSWELVVPDVLESLKKISANILTPGFRGSIKIGAHEIDVRVTMTNQH